ncbi:DUF664 domain-containing protein [Embleya scabrispora]|uniref:mycothiol transferase n=1 Tax=Embleya scabrispora TaxID=159449 RepID=UPI00099E2CBD|nr:DUF664 domain-containing protein [Embleya scabrispora]MYS87503.1 DUF664 domain-containing protein [Streptomyces sp. SID5474]
MNGEDSRSPWSHVPGEYADFDIDNADVDETFAAWREECERARAVVAGAESLAVTGTAGGDMYSLRWVLTHMIEEYAQHNGHADFLRERLDGGTGE